MLTEDQEAAKFHQWLVRKGLRYTHVANESRSGRYGMIRGAKLKGMGQSAGFPDFLVILPSEIGSRLLFIELKRTRGSHTSKEQKNWLNDLDACAGVETAICKGADAAIKFVEHRL